MKFVMPWPPSALSPNARHGHWAPLAKAKKEYREACAWTAKEQGARRLDASRLAVALTFVPPDRRHYDWDNLIARMKSGLDGLADVLGVDDRYWEISLKVKHGVVGGFVSVEVVTC